MKLLMCTLCAYVCVCVCWFVCMYMATAAVAAAAATAAAAASASPQGRFHLHLLQFCCISVSAGVAALMLLPQGGWWAASVVNGRGRGQLAIMARQRGISNCQAPSRLGSCTWPHTHTLIHRYSSSLTDTHTLADVASAIAQKVHSLSHWNVSEQTMR